MPMNWLFLDMNSFFASAEQHLRPELRGHPIGVIPVETDRTCVIAASVEAKRAGVRTGTSVGDARAMCPGIRLIKARPDVYVRLHHRIAASIDRWIPIHKAYSIDEWAMRLVGKQREAEKAVDLGKRIKAQIAADHSRWLPCSVGIAPTRLLAKIACELEKPDGLSILATDDLPHRLGHLSLKDLTGINRGVAARLYRHGVEDIDGLWALSRQRSIEIWGSVVGAHWWAGFHGHDEPEQQTRKRSMSHANVLEPRLRNEAGVRGMLARLIYRLGIRLRDEGMLAGRLSVSVKYARHEGEFSAQTPLPLVQDTPSLLRAFTEMWADGSSRRSPGAIPMQTGACVSGLVHESQATGCLFGEPVADTRLSRAMDLINRRWGPGAAYFGALHGCSHEMDEKIAFGRVPTARGEQANETIKVAPTAGKTGQAMTGIDGGYTGGPE
ncbi:MAG: hypothetical protein WD114_07070 [Phycisphaerales bacterium]